MLITIYYLKQCETDPPEDLLLLSTNAVTAVDNQNPQHTKRTGDGTFSMSTRRFTFASSMPQNNLYLATLLVYCRGHAVEKCSAKGYGYAYQ